MGPRLGGHIDVFGIDPGKDDGKYPVKCLKYQDTLNYIVVKTFANKVVVQETTEGFNKEKVNGPVDPRTGKGKRIVKIDPKTNEPIDLETTFVACEPCSARLGTDKWIKVHTETLSLAKRLNKKANDAYGSSISEPVKFTCNDFINCSCTDPNEVTEQGPAKLYKFDWACSVQCASKRCNKWRRIGADNWNVSRLFLSSFNSSSLNSYLRSTTWL